MDPEATHGVSSSPARCWRVYDGGSRVGKEAWWCNWPAGSLGISADEGGFKGSEVHMRLEI